MKSSVKPHSALLKILGAKWPLLLSYLHFQCFYETWNIHLYFLLHFMLIDPFEMLGTMTIFRQNGPKKKAL